MTYATAAPTPIKGKSRGPKAIVGLNLITLGLYSIYWWHSINSELRDLGESYDQSELQNRPALSAMAFGLGGCLLIPYMWTAVTTSRRILSARRMVGVTGAMHSWLIIGLFGASAVIGVAAGGSAPALVAAIVAAFVLEVSAMTYMQMLINEIWQVHDRSIELPDTHLRGLHAPALPRV